MKQIPETQKYISCVFKLVVFMSAVTGTIMSAGAGKGSFMGGRAVFMYFTIQSNIALAIICAVGAWLLLKQSGAGRVWYIIKFVGTVSITLTGVVFCFVLAPTMGAKAWNVQNILTHVVVPVVSVLDFFLVGAYGNIQRKDTLYVILPPLAYAVYAGIGYIQNWQFAKGINYPYFFLNWGSSAGAFGFSKELPFMGCMWWILLLFCFLWAVGFLYLYVLKLIKKKTASEA